MATKYAMAAPLILTNPRLSRGSSREDIGGECCRVRGGTFHAVGNSVLRRHGRLLGLDPDFTVLDQADAADLLALVRNELQAHVGEKTSDRRRATKVTMAAILSRVINTATPLSKV